MQTTKRAKPRSCDRLSLGRSEGVVIVLVSSRAGVRRHAAFDAEAKTRKSKPKSAVIFVLETYSRRRRVRSVLPG